jgi:solute carrier family 20 (sodium-dependent phosphate transporter)
LLWLLDEIPLVRRGLVGFGLVAEGKKAVNWYTYNEEADFPIEGIVAVVLSWIMSPLASGILGVAFFLVSRTAILRSERSYDRAFVFLPLLTGVCVFINAFYVLDKGINKQWSFVDDRTDRSAWIAAIIAVVATILTAGLSAFLKKKADQQAKDVENGVEKPSDGT